MTKTFKVISGDIAPPVSSDQARIVHEISDRFFGKILTVDNEEQYTLVAFDFKNQKWKSPISGIISVIEYYVD